MAKRQQRLLKAGTLPLAILLLVLGCGQPTFAQLLRPEVREQFLSSPLEDDPRDPLLPNPPISRPLSPLEKLALQADLDRLNQMAMERLASDQAEAAYDLWMREVRLRRLLGLEQELAAIERVGQRVWDGGRNQEVRLLTARLAEIRSQLEPDVDTGQLNQVADRFVQLGDPDAAIAIYRQLAALSHQQGQQAQHQAYLETIAQTQRQWFQFIEAASTYQDLYALNLATPEDKLRYLKAIVNSYVQIRQYQPALAAQHVLLQFYRWQALSDPIPALQLSMGDHYRALNRWDAASEQYQQAYEQAIALTQYEIAGDSIASLANLYQQLGREEEQVYLYQQLIVVHRQAYDAYGLMQTYDQLAQTYEALKRPEAALSAYREGLILASHLDEDQGYFRAQIRRLTPDNTWMEGWQP